MALANGSITLAVDEKLNLRCTPCGCEMELDMVAMLSRQQPGGEFYPMCHPCFVEVVKAAMRHLELEDALSTALN